ncbi:MAG: hypothetical protein D6698_16240, partial [Gammaproteobacteria bacterium]
MAVTMIPYGRLADGNYGILLDVNGKSMSAVIEALDTLPPDTSADNFDGRVVLDKSTGNLYYFYDGSWHSIGDQYVRVGDVNGSPPLTPTPNVGAMFLDTSSSQLFVWDGSTWVSTTENVAAAIYGTTYYGDGVTTSFILKSGSADPNLVEVFLDG